MWEWAKPASAGMLRTATEFISRSTAARRGGMWGWSRRYHIGSIRVHPKNPDIVYVAALGHLFGPNPERGVYRSTDGGGTWKQVFTRGADAGAVDLAMDPSNPRVLYAGFWQVRRNPYHFDSGGPGSGLFKSTDGGDTWTDLSHAPGMPAGVQGRIGVTVSPANPERVWAIVEAAEGGMFRSENAGRTWTRVNQQSIRGSARGITRTSSRTRSPPNGVSLNVGIYRSIDGGRTWSALNPPHGDNHDLWIAPDNPQRMIEANDGGATITTDGGKTWSTIINQPTAQFYRVALDKDFPYNIYGAQQDNTTVRIASRTASARHHGARLVRRGRRRERLDRAGSARYADRVCGILRRADHAAGPPDGADAQINAWPDNTMGYGAEAMK